MAADICKEYLSVKKRRLGPLIKDMRAIYLTSLCWELQCALFKDVSFPSVNFQKMHASGPFLDLRR
jgi:hypothetical protein